MSKENSMAVFDDCLLYEQVNLQETVTYCIARNPVLRTRTQQEVEAAFLEKISSDIKVNDQNRNFLGQQHPVYGAFYCVDRHDSSVLKADGETFGKGRFELSVFVKLGRKVINAKTH